MSKRGQSEHTILVMLLLALAAALGFFDVAFSRAQKKSTSPAAAAPAQTLVATPTTAVPTPVPEPSPLTMLFAGDVMLSRHVDTVIQRAKDPAFPWQLVKERTVAADFFFVNLEAPFSEQGPYDDGNLVFAVRPENVAGLVQAGVDVVSFANNHYRDAGTAGVETTKRVLTEHDIAPALPGEPAVVVRAGRMIGVVASAYNLGLDENALRKDIAAVRQRGATFIVASMHAGVEYAATPSAAQRQFSHAAIDAGADLVVGHHPHVTQTTEAYAGKYIVYSLGNFIFDQFWSDETMRGQALEVVLPSSDKPTYTLRDVRINRQAQPALDQQGIGA